MYTYPCFVRQNDENQEMQGDFNDFHLHFFCMLFIIEFTKKGTSLFRPRREPRGVRPGSRPQIFMEMNEK